MKKEHETQSVPARAQSSRLRRFLRTETTMFFDPNAKPLAQIGDCERIIVETADSVCKLAKSDVHQGYHIDEVLDRVGGACPVTGPFFIEGAKPGDVIEVEIHRVDEWPQEGEGWTGIFAGFGGLTHEAFSLEAPLEPELMMVPYANGQAILSFQDRQISVPLNPFIGTMGVAPRWERRMTFSQSPEYLGDVDIPTMGPGSVVVLPVNVEGALLGLGDVHGAQGDGEITGVAIELEAEVELTIRVKSKDKAQFVKLPQVNTETIIGSVAGLYGTHIGDCSRTAYTDLVRRLVRYYGFDKKDAYVLVGQTGRLQIGNMIDPFYSVLAYINREFIH